MGGNIFVPITSIKIFVGLTCLETAIGILKSNGPLKPLVSLSGFCWYFAPVLVQAKSECIIPQAVLCVGPTQGWVSVQLSGKPLAVPSRKGEKRDVDINGSVVANGHANGAANGETHHQLEDDARRTAMSMCSWQIFFWEGKRFLDRCAQKAGSHQSVCKTFVITATMAPWVKLCHVLVRS